MKMNNAKYLYLHTSGYFFRYSIPKDIRPIVKKTELRYSVKAHSRTTAKHRAKTLASITQAIINDIRKGGTMSELKPEQIHKLLAQYFKEALDKDEVYRLERKPINDDELDHRIDLYGSLKADAQESLAKSNHRSKAKDADKLLAQHKVSLSHGSESFKILCRELLKLDVNLFDICQKREFGEYDHYNLRRYEALKEHQTRQKGELLSKVIDHYLSENRTKWTSKTEGEILTSLNLFLEIMDDLFIKNYDRSKIRIFKESLSKLPANLKQKKAYRDKTIKELLKMDIPQKDRLAVNTINKHLTRIGTLFNFAAINGFIDSNPAKEMQLPEDKRADEYRTIFDHDDLINLFHSDEYLHDYHDANYKFWIPIIALYTGARLNEIAQLYLSDIHQDQGVWVFDINDQQDKKLKNRASKRIVPIHPLLIDLNLIGYAERLKAEGETRLFPELTKRRDGYGHTVSDWFRAYKQKCNIIQEDRKKDFHSFRGTFITNLTYRQVPDRMLKQVVGHSEGDDITFGRYAERFSPKDLFDNVISKLDYEIDFSHLKNSRFAR